MRIGFGILKLMNMKLFFFIGLFLNLTVCLSQSSNSYPNKAITIIAPYTSGTTSDVLARQIGNKLSEKLGYPILVENKSGASGVIGTDFVSKSPANGYTLLFTATSHGTIPAVKSKLPYDPIKSFSPVILLATSAMGFVVSQNINASNFKEFLEYSKSKGNELDYSTPGEGSSQHLTMELVLQEVGFKMVHVPYKGSSGAVTDVIGGHVQSSIVSLQTSSSFIKSGQLKMLAIMSDERSPVFQNVPTFKELGYPNLVVDTWYGVLAPLNTPVEIINKLNYEINLILNTNEMKETMNKLGLTISGGKSDKLKNLLDKEIPKWRKVVATSKIEID
jgi:tripartite-type tricarboxylate transporter receptor subunit TctC